MNKATHPKKKEGITTQQEAERALEKINHIDGKLTNLILQEEQAIAKVRKKFQQGKIAERKMELLEKKMEAEKELTNFAKLDRKNWRHKSIKTNAGVYGFRVGQPSVSLIKSISKSDKEAAINTLAKYRPFVSRVYVLDKEHMCRSYMNGTLDEERLKLCGLKVKQSETFFIKSKTAEALEEAKAKLKKV